MKSLSIFGVFLAFALAINTPNDQQQQQQQQELEEEFITNQNEKFRLLLGSLSEEFQKFDQSFDEFEQSRHELTRMLEDFCDKFAINVDFDRVQNDFTQG
jgi:hypothetical protein